MSQAPTISAGDLLLPTRSTPAVSPQPTVGLGLDARTALLGLLLVNIAMLSLFNLPAMFLALALLLVALASLRKPKLLIGATAFLGISLLAFLAPRFLNDNPVIALFATMGFWFMRFGIVMFAAAYVVLSVPASDFVATLHRFRAPSWLVIPLTVMLRFIPQARQEFLAITEAMALRGIPLGPGAWLRHPLRSIEYLTVPLLVSCSRLADDLTASGMVRGLGGRQSPTPLTISCFTWRDALAMFAFAALLGLAIFAGRGGL